MTHSLRYRNSSAASPDQHARSGSPGHEPRRSGNTGAARRMKPAGDEKNANLTTPLLAPNLRQCATREEQWLPHRPSISTVTLADRALPLEPKQLGARRLEGRTARHRGGRRQDAVLAREEPTLARGVPRREAGEQLRCESARVPRECGAARVRTSEASKCTCPAQHAERPKGCSSGFGSPGGTATCQPRADENRSRLETLTSCASTRPT